MSSQAARASNEAAGTIPAQVVLRPPASRLSGRVLLALVALYFIWGSTYFAIRIALGSFPPLLMAGLRYVIAGALLFAVLKLRGEATPSRQGWIAAAKIGTLLVGANALVVVSEQWVSSGMAAVLIASVPLVAALISGLLGRWPTRGEWLGLGVGLSGVLVLNLGGELSGSRLGAGVLLLSTICWASGSVWSKRLPLPKGMMASAAEMLCGGAVLFAASLVRGERFTAMPTAPALGAFVYLIVFGSIVAFSAYVYLLANVRPALATSYAYVNPVVAVALGALFLGEKVSGLAIIAMALILSGVALVATRRAAGS